MGKKFLTIGNIEIEKNKFYQQKISKKYYCLTKLLLVKKTISTFLVTCIMVIKLNH